MPFRIACLHTAASNAAVFEAACPPGAILRHAVRADLLSAAGLAVLLRSRGAA